MLTGRPCRSWQMTLCEPPCPGCRWWCHLEWRRAACAPARRRDTGCRCTRGTATCRWWCGGCDLLQASETHQRMCPRCPGSLWWCGTEEERSDIRWTEKTVCVCPWWDSHLPNEAAGRDGGGCKAVTFTSWPVREDVAALKGAADDLVRVKREISDWNTFIVAASGLKK